MKGFSKVKAWAVDLVFYRWDCFKFYLDFIEINKQSNVYEDYKKAILGNPGVIHYVTLHSWWMKCNVMGHTWVTEDAKKLS